MPKPLFDLQVLGDREAERAIATLERRLQRVVVSRALRESAKRTKQVMVSKLSGNPVAVRTGTLRGAFAKARIRAGKRRRGMLRLGVVWPSREELGIDPSDRYFYPVAIEYGHRRAPPHPFARPAVDERRSVELRAIGRSIRTGVLTEARKARSRSQIR